MIKVVALAFGIAAIPVMMAAPPAKAYDPCERAINEYQQAVAIRDAARQCNGNVCFTPAWAAQAVYDARVRVTRECN